MEEFNEKESVKQAVIHACDV